MMVFVSCLLQFPLHGSKMEGIHAIERGCCEASWEIEGVKEVVVGKWEEEKRRSQGTQ